MQTIMVLDNGIDMVASIITKRTLLDTDFEICTVHELDEAVSTLTKKKVPIIVVEAHRPNIDQAIKTLLRKGFNKSTLIILSVEDCFRVRVQRSLETEYHNRPHLKGLRTISVDDKDFPTTLMREIKLLE